MAVVSTATGLHGEVTEEEILGEVVPVEGAVETTRLVAVARFAATTAPAVEVVVADVVVETVSVHRRGVAVTASVATAVAASGLLNTTFTFPTTVAAVAMIGGVTIAAGGPGLGRPPTLVRALGPAQDALALLILALALGLSRVLVRLLVVVLRILPKPVVVVISVPGRRLGRSVVGAETGVALGDSHHRLAVPLPRSAGGTRHPEAGRATGAAAQLGLCHRVVRPDTRAATVAGVHRPVGGEVDVPGATAAAEAGAGVSAEAEAEAHCLMRTTKVA